MDDREAEAAASRDRAIELAEERTRLARERTTLSHIRTGFASFLFGTALVGLFGAVEAKVLGAAFVLAGVAFLATGWLSYVRSSRRVRTVIREVERTVGRE
ncbi:MAG: DUF202 domain-containing protein [Haloarculaceae archaeon]